MKPRSPFPCCVSCPPGWLLVVLLLTARSPAGAAPLPDARWQAWFATATARLRDERAALRAAATRDSWAAAVPERRRQLREMLGLDPWPERTDLHPVVTGQVTHPEFVVDKVQFQSLPGLYVTGDLYRPRGVVGKVPAVLYVCGHGRVVQEGVSLGNKAHYQHHGAWFARHGYVCLVIDTIQLGEIEGLHHGTYREGLWWWNSRGYTPAGVEAWNAVRALDYLQSRPEVDPDRIGITGRSGGGAYSWWTAAIDERVKAAAPVAGITDLENHAVDGVVEGHCDCMYLINTYHWDYWEVAALVAPRPLLIGNTDRDPIFPLDGVVRLHDAVRDIYRLYGAEDRLGLLITEGSHQDTQDLQVPVLRWFNRHLKGEDPLIRVAAEKLLDPATLKVFDQLPADERVTTIQEDFVPRATLPALPADTAAWAETRDHLLTAVRRQVFGDLGTNEPVAELMLRDERLRPQGRWAQYDLAVDGGLELPVWVIEPLQVERHGIARVQVMDEAGWQGWRVRLEDGFTGPVRNGPPLVDTRTVLLAPRAVGPTRPDLDERRWVQLRRRFMLLGMTLDSARVTDVYAALAALRKLPDYRGRPLELAGAGDMAVNALYAALLSPPLAALELAGLPASHRDGPDYLNVLKVMDLPVALALAVEQSPVRLPGAAPGVADWARQVGDRLGWPGDRVRAE